MPVRFEHTTPVFQRAETVHASGRPATVILYSFNNAKINFHK
jgi:hypothetical protein